MRLLIPFRRSTSRASHLHLRSCFHLSLRAAPRRLPAVVVVHDDGSLLRRLVFINDLLYQRLLRLRPLWTAAAAGACGDGGATRVVLPAGWRVGRVAGDGVALLKIEGNKKKLLYPGRDPIFFLLYTATAGHLPQH